MTTLEGVALIRLNRPEKGNALSAELVDNLTQQICAARDDLSIHTIAFVGEGRHFCTGFDLSDLNDTTDATLLHRFVNVELLLDLIWNLPVKTVALAKGRTTGAGADLLTACDVRLATPGTQIAFPGAQFGLVLGTARLIDRIGRDLAHAVIRSGETLTLARAREYRLVTDVIADDAALASSQWLEPPVIDRATIAALRAATPSVDHGLSLAALVRSAARPGLKQRILDYRAGQK